MLRAVGTQKDSARHQRDECARSVRLQSLRNDKLDMVNWNNGMVKPPKARDHDPMRRNNDVSMRYSYYHRSWDCVTADKALGVDEHISSHLSDTHTHG